MLIFQLALAVNAAWSAPAMEKTLNTFKDLESYLKGKGAASSLDGFLDHVAKDYSGTLQSFALVYESRSLQNASAAFPRVILFGQGFDDNSAAYTGLVLTFPGDPTKSDYNAMEVMSIDDGKRIQLAEIRFSGTSGSPTIEKNPARCIACHGDRTRPIWDSYPVWPGVYGSEEDEMDARSDELANFRALVPKFGKPGRYQHLKLNADKVTTPYGESMTFGNDVNRELGMMLDQFSGRDVIDELRQRPTFGVLKYALLGAMGGCFDKTPNAWFSSSAEALMGLDFDQVQSVTSADIVANENHKTRRFFNIHGNPVPMDGGHLRSEDPTQHAAGVRFASLLAGDDMRSWSKSFSPQAFSFATRGLENFLYILYQQLKSDKVVSDAIVDPTPIDLRVSCDKLASANRSIVSDDMAKKIGATIPALTADLTGNGLARQAPLLRCISCHTDPLRGPNGKPLAPSEGQPPFYPFDQPVVLSRMLAADDGTLAKRMIAAVTAPPGAAGRMPKAPFPPLTMKEQGAVVDLIKALEKSGL